MKKKQASDEQRLIGMSAPVQAVIPIPNPAPTKVKIPIRLHNRIRETREPVVGLGKMKPYGTVTNTLFRFVTLPAFNLTYGTGTL